MILQIDTDANNRKQVVSEWLSIQDIAKQTSYKIDGILDAIENKRPYQGQWWINIKQ